MYCELHATFNTILAAVLLSLVGAGMVLDDSLSVASSIGPKQLCESGEFSSDCPVNHVVVFRSAAYQRSEGTGCIDGNYKEDLNFSSGNCSLDVTAIFDESCFGKWSCSVALNDHELKWSADYQSGGCTDNGKAFVSLSYDCIAVENNACFSCENSEYAKLTQSKGYLASVVTLDGRISHQCGNSRCPWFVRVPPGQVINVTIVDSHRQGHHRQSSSLSSESSSCQKKYVIIKERANPKDFYYCGSKQRVNHLYLSVSNSIEIHVNGDHLSNVGGQFLIYYEVIGCADIIPPRYSRMKRNGDTYEIDCPATDLKWTLICRGQTWEGLDALGTCPPAPGLLEAERQKSSVGGSKSIFSLTLFDMPMGVLMALVIACAVILGVLILTTGLVCLKRNQYDVKHRDDPNVYGAACSEFEFREMGAGSIHPALLAKSAPYMNTGAFGAGRSRRASADLLMAGGVPRDNTYAMQELVKMDTRPLPSLPANAASSTQIQGNSWRRNDGPVPYGVVKFYPPGTNQTNRVTVQLHRTDSGVEYPPGSTYRARFPTPGGQYPTRYVGPACGRYDPRNTASRRMPGPAGGYNELQLENHYFVLDGNACSDDAETLEKNSDHQTTSTMPFPQPPPAHQNPRPPVTTNPRLPVGNSVMMATHRHQHSFGGGDLRCTCDDRLFPMTGNYPPPNPDDYYAPDQILRDAKTAGDINKSSGSINDQI